MAGPEPSAGVRAFFAKMVRQPVSGEERPWSVPAGFRRWPAPQGLPDRAATFRGAEQRLV